MSETKQVEAVQEATGKAETTNVAAEAVQEAAATTTAVGATKNAKTGNVILDIAHEIEGLSKTKALNMATSLADNIELNYFKLGGVLQLMFDNSWFDGFTDFDAMVLEKFGFQGRKARYLISIYDHLVKKQIPWEKVQHLGWTKLKDLAPVLTLENVDEWVAKATPVTVLELQAMLKAAGGGGETASKVKADVTVVKFPMKADQVEVVTQALAKAKGEAQTDYDTVALELICSGYLGGTSSVVKSYSLDEVIQQSGFQTAIERISDLFPEYDITVKNAKPAEAKEEAKS